MAISKSTPYVRYKKDFTSSLHLGTIHIESEYLDRTQKTTIESIHGMTWHNKVVNKNKELNLLSDTQLELTELEKQYWNTGEKRVSVDEIHTLEEVEPNEDGTYTYTVNSMEGEYIEIYDGINNITSTSDGLDGQFEIVYDTTEEDINGNIVLDSIVPQYEITDSGIGTVTGAKSTGLTLVNHITESSKEEVVAIEQQEGQYFTIENTVQGNIKSAILKGQTLTYPIKFKNYKLQVTVTGGDSAWKHITDLSSNLDINKKYLIKFDVIENTLNNGINGVNILLRQVSTGGSTYYCKVLENNCCVVSLNEKYANIDSVYIYATTSATEGNFTIENFMLLEYQEGMENWDIPYFEGMQSVKMPVLTIVGKNLLNCEFELGWIDGSTGQISLSTLSVATTNTIKVSPSTQYSVTRQSGTRSIIAEFDCNNNYLGYVEGDTFKTKSNTSSIRIFIQNTTDKDGHLLCLGSNANEIYEPYKSNILTTSEEVELRGIGDVKDELNLITGELTQRVGEVVLNENIVWMLNKTLGDGSYNQFVSSAGTVKAIKVSQQLVNCDKLKSFADESANNVIWIYDGSTIVLHSSCKTVEEFTEWITSNPITIQYQLATPTVKTVDLTVQNQDGSTIPHIQTQPTTTYVSTSSDGLTPTVEMSCSYDTIIKPNTTYTIKLDRPIVSDTMYLQVDLGGTMMMLDADVNAFTIKTPSTLSHSQLRLSGAGNTVKEIIVLEGNRVNDKIEYFEGMKNVENPILIVSNCPFDNITYENYQSTTLSLNEPIQLRSIGDVHDEINYETGEYIQRIHEVVFDGSDDEDWVLSKSDTIIPMMNINLQIPKYGGNDVTGIISTIGVSQIYTGNNNVGCCIVVLNNTERKLLRVRTQDVLNGQTVEEYREYLSKHPLTIQYVIEPITTKIDTTILDQDNNYKSSQQTYDESTHISVQSDTVVTPSSSVDYEIYSSTGTITGTSATIENAEAGTPVSGVVYGETLLNVIQEPSEDEFVCTDNFSGKETTIENSVAGSVKDVIIKGQTLVNLTCHGRYLQGASDVNLTKGKLTWTTNGEWQRVYFVVNGEPNTKYIIKYQSIHENVEIYYRLDTTNINQGGAERIYSSNSTITTGETGTFIVSLERETASSDSWVQDFMIIEYQEGMENWDIPYFEGMESVTNYRTIENMQPTCTYTENSGGTYWCDTATVNPTVGSQYFIKIFNNPNNAITRFFYGGVIVDTTTDYGIITATDATGVKLHFYNLNSATVTITEEQKNAIRFLICEYQDGMENWEINEHFEESYTVQMPILKTIGKNLYPYGNIDFTSTNDGWHDSVGTPEMWGDIGSISKARFFLRKGQYVFNANFDTVENFKGFTVVGDDEAYIFGYTIGNNDTNIFVVPNDMYLTIRVKLLNKNTHTFMENIQIEEGSVVTEYEPHKSTTVTVNENIGLNSIGDVYDELNVTTGELTKYVGIDENSQLYLLDTPIIEKVNVIIIDQDNVQQKYIQLYDTITYLNPQSYELIPTVEYKNPSYDVLLKENTQYTIKLNRTNIIDGTPLTVNLGGTELSIEDSADSFTITTPNTLTNNTLSIGGFGNRIKEVMIIEGDYVDRDLGFFEGFISVENPILQIYNDNMPNTLTTYPQVTLRSIGDIKDEWDVVGETVTKRIGEIVFDGSEDWYNMDKETDNYIMFKSSPFSVKFIPPICDRFKTYSTHMPNIDESKGELLNLQTDNNCFQITIKKERLLSNNVDEFKQWLAENPTTVQYELAEPITESVRITPPNPQTSTVSITIPTQLNHVEDTSDFLVWNPYKEHYVRYNYVEDGVVLDNYTWENLTDLNERQFVEFYNRRTYIDQPYYSYVASHDSKGTSKYVLIEPNQDYTVNVRFSKLPTCETVKVNLGGTEVEMNVNDPHVHVTTPNTLVNNLCSISGDGLDGKVTDILVIHCLEHEGFADIDYFEGIDGIGEIVEVDGVEKASIVMEQTNGNLLDFEPVVFNNGNYISMAWNENNRAIPIHPNKEYIFKLPKRFDNEWGDNSLRLYDSNLKQTRTISNSSINDWRRFIFTPTVDEKYVRMFAQFGNHGEAHCHVPVELCYADMEKDYIRPRYYDKEEILLPMQLHRINTVYDNFYYDEMKGYYRIQQSIGHKYFVGADSENWTLIERGQRVLRFRYNNADVQMKSLGEFMTNRLPNGTATSPYECCAFSGSTFIVSIDKERLTSESLIAFKEWLANNNLHLYYQLASPLMIDLPQYPNRIEFNTYKDEIYTFFKNCKPTVFTLAVPLDQTYRFYDLEEGQGYANRIELTDERMTEEDKLYVHTIYGSGISNLIEEPNNVDTMLKPNYEGKATSHSLTNGKVSSIGVHGFEANDVTIENYNTVTKQYELTVQAQQGTNTNTETLAVPYKLEIYEDGTKDRVYYNSQYKQWMFEGGQTLTVPYNESTGAFTSVVEVFRGLQPRSGLIGEFKVRFASGTTSARLYYSINGTTYGYTTLRSMTDEVDYYIGFFNTGGTKIDMGTKIDANTEYTTLVPINATVPECLMINQIQSITECTYYQDKTYYYLDVVSPLLLDVYNGTTTITELNGAVIDIQNNAHNKQALIYGDTTYTVYWTYVGGEGNIKVTLGGVTQEVAATQGYVTITTSDTNLERGLLIGGFDVTIKDLMLIKGERITDLKYFEGSRAVGTAFTDEDGNTMYRITFVTGSELINDKFEDMITFEDNKKHNVVVTKLLGAKPDKN